MINELIERLAKCPNCTCSRCAYDGTDACAVTEAIRELKRFDQVIEILSREVDTE